MSPRPRGIWYSRKSTRFREYRRLGVVPLLTARRIHIYNLLSVAFLATPEPTKTPALAFLHVTPDYTIELVAKVFSDTTHEFKDLCAAIDVLSPPSTYALPSGTNPPARPDPSALQDDFACPGAAKLLALPPPTDDIDDDTRLGGILVIGDEFSAAYTLRTEKSRTSSVSSAQTASDARTSPENTKRRKGSAGGSLVPVIGKSSDAAGKIVLARQWRVRQGFGEVSGYVC